MSELGSNQGQDENKNGPVFDSSKLSKEQTTEHFTNVKGAENRAKAAEREAKEAEKAANKKRNNEVKKAAKMLNKEPRSSKGGILKFLFGGWHKIVTLAILVGLIVGAVLLIINPFKEPYSTRKEKDETALASAVKVEDDARTVFVVNPNEETYGAAKELYENAIMRADKRGKVFLKIMYADFIYKNTNDFNSAIIVLDGVDKDIDTEVSANYYNFKVRNIYFEAGEADNFQEIIVEAE